MKGDFTRDRFDPATGYTRVLKQQGRVDLDSDWNEQAAIQQHLLRTLIVDLLGPAAGPLDQCGFGLADPNDTKIGQTPGDFHLTAGRYYVGGLLVQAAAPFSYAGQPWVADDARLEDGATYLAYLDVWERHVTWLDDPTIREPALGGPDTCTRAQTVWCVRTLPVKEEPRVEDRDGVSTTVSADMDGKIVAIKQALDALVAKIKAGVKDDERAALTAERTKLQAELRRLTAAAKPAAAGAAAPDGRRDGDHGACDALLQPLRDERSGTLTARVRPQAPSDSPCVLSPESRYRGLENQLYRIEIHATGTVGDANAAPSFKWSRDNGAIATPLLDADGRRLTVASPRGFDSQCCVEILTEAQDAQGLGGFVASVTAIDGDELLLAADLPFAFDAAANPRVRRWDALPARIKPDEWTAIEDGIEVYFTKDTYRAGNYWLIPARVATGGIDWPEHADGQPADRAPAGIVHHYAPLFVVTATEGKPFFKLVEDCRCHITRMRCGA